MLFIEHRQHPSIKSNEVTYMSVLEPEPASDKTLTAMTLAAFATPYWVEAIVPAQCVP